jgi:aminobenzoyl-glutamate utilization protein B
VHTRLRLLAPTIALALFATPLTSQGRGAGGGAPSNIPPDDAKMTALKEDAFKMVDSMSAMTAQIVDMLFSFGELGFQEVQTSKYLTALLEQHGFTVERQVANIPTAWVARWSHGTGKPVISLGSDIDGIPQASQKPGVAYRDPLVVGAPGHGEGHNSGQAVNITAAFALKKIMEREKIDGTIMIWPGVAEEQMAAKAYLVRAGIFKDVDAVLFSHVASSMSVSSGQSGQLALISALFSFRGKAAHAAADPWAGRSALDAVELMDVAWQFRREHLPLQQRSHSVIVDGGDQPNVVPQTASVWYFFRQTDTPLVKELFALADTIAEGAAMMTGTQLESVRVLGSGWSGHFNRPIADAMTRNIGMVGTPEWSDADQQLARALQCEIGVRQSGLSGGRGGGGGRAAGAGGRGGRGGAGAAAADTSDSAAARGGRGGLGAGGGGARGGGGGGGGGGGAAGGGGGGGSDDIGDISWNVPTVTLRYPANIPGLPGHNWTDAIAMATPIAHKGSTAGAKVQAATMLDLYLKPTILEQAWTYFRDVQTATTKYEPLMRPEDTPATYLNADILAKYRPEMSKFYYDTTKYSSYLEQLGITYPTVHPCTPGGN